MLVYDRAKQEMVEEEQFGGKILTFLYGNPLGRLLLYGIAAKPFYSDRHAAKLRQAKSISRIAPLVEEYAIDRTEFQTQTFDSFADFFERDLKPEARPVAAEPALIAPADSRLLVYSAEGTALPVKGLHYSLETLLGDSALAKEFTDGTVLVYRLTMADCHRYIQIDDGKMLAKKVIPGLLHTVSRFSEKILVWTENKREYQVQELKNFGRVINLEVGAIRVGAIHNRDALTFYRGEEKGYFSLGGSTILQIFRKGSIRVAEDILAQSREGRETKVRRGEAIGVATKEGETA